MAFDPKDLSDDVLGFLRERHAGTLTTLNNFHRLALTYAEETGHGLADPGLAWLPVTEDGDTWSRVGQCYVEAMKAALDYAQLNRQHMLDRIGEILARRFSDALRWEGMVNIHHNDAAREEHFGRQVWVHRKGAVKADHETPTVTPGSMGTGSYLGRGLGHPNRRHGRIAGARSRSWGGGDRGCHGHDDR